MWDRFEPIAEWLGKTGLAAWLGASTGRVAWLFVFHLLGLTMLLSTTMLVSLRLLGVAMRRESAAGLWRELRPYNYCGLGLMILSGGLIFIGGEPTYFHGHWFHIKMEILFFALIFHFTVFRKTTLTDNGRLSPRWDKMTGIITLLLWLGVATSGRLIAFLN